MTDRPHRPRRRCCYSRLGRPKAVHRSLEAAEAARVWAEKHYKDGPMEVYQCRVHPGRWHIRKARPEYAARADEELVSA